jgi:tetratricopeptide (TPR) repeat protein
MNPYMADEWHGLKGFIFIILFFFWAVAPSLTQERMGRGRITGTCVDENGQPLEGVLVAVRSLNDKTNLEGVSDKTGHFAVMGMGTGVWKITASRKGYASSSIDMNIRQLKANPPITFTLKKLKGISSLMADEESVKLFDQGNSLINEAKYDEAIKVFDEFLGKHPEIYYVHLNIGSCYLKKGDLDKAEQEFKFVLDKTIQAFGDYKKDTATSLRAFSGLGEIYLKKEDFDTAQKYFSQALEISPEDEVAAYNVGEVFFSHQKIDDAIKYLELAIKVKKDWSKPYLKLAYVCLNKGDFSKSLEYFNQFIKMDPENPEVPNVRNMIAAIEKMKK